MNKKDLKYLFGSIAFIAIFAVILTMLSFVFTPKNNNPDFGMPDATANGILGEEENTIDVVVVGDSEAYSSISPMEIWNKHRLTSYICATSAQYITCSDTMLEQAFQKQNPKVVILETNTIYRDVKSENSIMTKAENSISIIKYHDRWKNIKLYDFNTSAQYTWTDDYKGYHLKKGVLAPKKTDYMAPDEKIEDINKLNAKYVKAISEKCKDNNAQLILLSTPSTKNWTMAKHNGIQKLAEEIGVEHIDLNLMNDVIKIDWSKDTCDAGDHLNYSGAKKVTDFIGNYLTEELGLNGSYDKKVCEKWDSTYKRYSDKIK